MALQRAGIVAMGARRVKAQSSVFGRGGVVTVHVRPEIPYLYLHLEWKSDFEPNIVLLHITFPLG